MGFLSTSVAVLAAVSLARGLSTCASTGARPQYDYVIVGAGAGGGPLATRLAEAGFSVLVVEAGHVIDNVNMTIPLYFARGTQDPQMGLNYTYSEYPAGFKYSRQNQWYPRGQGLGGSTLNNAAINILSGSRADFDGLASTFNDPSWSRDNMQNYLKLIENNHYSPNDPDHGYNGWLHTNTNPAPELLDPKYLDEQFVDVAVAIASSGNPVADLNNLAGDNAAGVNSPSFTKDAQHHRSHVGQKLLAVQTATTTTGKLTFAMNTMATKILMCTGRDGRPSAYGVTVAGGAALPVASNFNGKTAMKLVNVTAKYEVIISAGVFQSPQLLMLSGIGDRTQVAKFGITPVVHLPGVGANLQDHDEITVVWKMNANYSIWEGCNLLSDASKDACLATWQTGKLNLYSFGGIFSAITAKSSPSLATPNILTYYAPARFIGFFPEFPDQLTAHNGFSATILRARPSSRGTVRLTGSHPQDRLDIQKNHFQAPGSAQDVIDIRNAIKAARALAAIPNIAKHIQSEQLPGPTVKTDAQIDDDIYKRVFGHHACCTNAMGTDANAVVNGNFQVRGVANLRIVDASTWPKVPGFFLATQTYMLSEKAADVIIRAAKEVAV